MTTPLTAELKAGAWSIKVVFVIVAVLIAAILLGVLLHNRDTNKGTRATVQQQTRTGNAAEAIATRAGEQQGQSAAVTQAAGETQVKIIHEYEVIRDANPQVRAFADTPVPAELRELAKRARLARERLGCTETGCPADDAAAAGAGQGDASGGREER